MSSGGRPALVCCGGASFGGANAGRRGENSAQPASEKGMLLLGTAQGVQVHPLTAPVELL